MHYYTYAYLREDKTPYYIGKGKGGRIYKKGTGEVKPPKDKSRIIYLKQNLTEEEAFRHEIYMIAVLGRIDLGTGILRNKTNGGEGVNGGIHSEKTKIKISAARKGKILSEEHRRKLSEANKGKTHSEKTRKKIGDANKDKILSKETRRKLSEWNKGKTLSDETKRKISEANKGKIHSEETKRKMSEVRKGRKWWNDGCGNCKRMIECPGNDWKPGRK